MGNEFDVFIILSVVRYTKKILFPSTKIQEKQGI